MPMIFSYNGGRCKRGYAATFFLLRLGLVVLFFTLFLTLSASAAEISLAWDASSTPVDGYQVFCREQGENYDYTQPVWGGSALTCTIYDLDEDVTYYFVVRAYNDSGESGNSNEACSAESSIFVSTGSEGGGCFIVSAGQGPKDRWSGRSKAFRWCPFEDVNRNELWQALLQRLPKPFLFIQPLF